MRIKSFKVHLEKRLNKAEIKEIEAAANIEVKAMNNVINEVGKVYQRPWGTYKTLEMGDGYQVKIITVNPGGQLSLQKHFKRAEHWVVIQGTPTITVSDSVKEYHVDETVNIPIETNHRLENFTHEPAAIIEVQIGRYLGEDDIVRLDDIYQR